MGNDIQRALKPGDHSLLAIYQEWRNAGDTNAEKTPLDDLSSQELIFVTRFMASGDAFQSAKDAGFSEYQTWTIKTVMDRPHVRRAIEVIKAGQAEQAAQTNRVRALQGDAEMAAVLADPTVPWQEKIMARREQRESLKSFGPAADEKATEKPVDAARAERIMKEVTKAIRTSDALNDVFDAATPKKDAI